MANDTANTQTQQSTSAPSSNLLTIPQFASEIKQRRPKLATIPDDVLVRETLQRRPQLMGMVQISEPRPKLKKDREPTVDQRMQKFFENHPLIREAVGGILGGAGASETSPTFGSQFADFGKGLWHTLSDPSKSKDETAAGPALPAYRIAKGLVQQTYGYGQEAFDAFDWNKFWETAKSKGDTESLPQVFTESLKTDESGRKIGAEHLVHATAGLATMIATALKGGKKVPEAVEAIERTGKGAAETVTTAAQRAAGTGPVLAEKIATGAVEDIAKHNAGELDRHAAATENHAANVEKVTGQNATADADYATKVERMNQDFDQKVADTRQKYADNVVERDKKVAELQGAHAEKVAQARAQWVQKAYEAKQAGQQAAKVAARREALEHGQKAYTKLVDENVKSTHKAVRSGLDARWNALREQVGTSTPVKAPPLFQAVESARSMLAGVPADLKIFNDIVKEITEKDAHVEGENGELSKLPKESIPFDDARTQYSAIGEKAFGADGNLRRALFTLYDAYDKALSDTANAAGAGKEYGALKSDWKSYMQDWHDMRGQATGGSPLARLLKAVDNPVVAGQVLGKFGDRLMQTFARYDKYGASPTLMSKLRNFNAAEKALPKTVRVPNAPERLSPPPSPHEPPPIPSVEPRVGEIEAERVKRLERTAQDKPTPKPLPEPPAAPDIKKQPTVDDALTALRQAKAERAKGVAESSKTFGRHDFYIGALSGLGAIGLHNFAWAVPYLAVKFGEMALVNSELGQNWISRITPQDIAKINEVLAKAPEERGSVSQALTNGLIAKARKGQPLPPLSRFQSLLNKAQIGAILRVVAPPVQSQPQPAAQAQVQ